MGRYSVKRYKTKRRTRDLDLIYYTDMGSTDAIRRLKNQPLDETKAGFGQYYCIECAHYYENQPALDRHNKGKKHKRRVKELNQRPYTNLEAEAASGLNMQKFTESVEKYKAMEQDKKAQPEVVEGLLRQRNETIEKIMGIDGPVSTEEGAGNVETKQQDGEVDMAT
ncbi:bud site selection protein 20 [[Candida] railenensis]|uniref:Bud site selection protein 20 n=1 Tax=[Candida] railenensis TaxID=45579 RepID=A0A9P0VWM0_9ASCO|nr:bud site selection protein 20 [[Candida] railenensis]